MYIYLRLPPRPQKAEKKRNETSYRFLLIINSVNFLYSARREKKYATPPTTKTRRDIPRGRNAFIMCKENRKKKTREVTKKLNTRQKKKKTHNGKKRNSERCEDHIHTYTHVLHCSVHTALKSLFALLYLSSYSLKHIQTRARYLETGGLQITSSGKSFSQLALRIQVDPVALDIVTELSDL